MTPQLILASSSAIRQQLLQRAGVVFDVETPRIDEDAIRAAMQAEQATPRDVADALAEFKAAKVAQKYPNGVVIGCDQVLEIEQRILAKPESPEDAGAQLRALSGQSHRLLSAIVVFENARPVWRNVGTVRLTMRDLSDTYIDDYIARNWESIRHSVGCYKLEEEGARLFTRIEGDYFTVLGLPLLELLSWLTLKGILRS